VYRGNWVIPERYLQLFLGSLVRPREKERERERERERGRGRETEREVFSFSQHLWISRCCVYICADLAKFFLLSILKARILLSRHNRIIKLSLIIKIPSLKANARASFWNFIYEIFHLSCVSWQIRDSMFLRWKIYEKSSYLYNYYLTFSLSSAN